MEGVGEDTWNSPFLQRGIYKIIGKDNHRILPSRPRIQPGIVVEASCMTGQLFLSDSDDNDKRVCKRWPAHICTDQNINHLQILYFQ